MPKQIPRIVFYGVCALLVLGALPLPLYAYYKYLRIVVFFFLLFGCFSAFKKSEESIWPWSYLFLATLFNPFYTIEFPKIVWIPIDLLVALLVMVRRNDWLGEAISSSMSDVASKERQISQLRLNLAQRELGCGDVVFKLEPTQFALYYLFVESRLCNVGGIDLTDDGVLQKYFDVYEKLVGKNSLRLAKAKQTYGSDTVSFVEYSRSRISTINSTFQKYFGDEEAKLLCILPIKVSKKTYYTINLAPERILLT